MPSRSGSEPTEARSALGARAVLASVAIVVGLAGAIWLWVDRPDSPAVTIAALSCLLVAVVSAVDLVIVVRRRRR
jgi:uncharacterized protein DUF6343